MLLLAGYHGDQLRYLYHGKEINGSSIKVLIEPEPAGTAGALKFAAEDLEDEFLLLNGDTYFDVNLLSINPISSTTDYIAAVALRSVESRARYGSVNLVEGNITAFKEKSSEDKDSPGLINGGIYYLKKAVLNYIESMPCSLEDQVLPRLAAINKLKGSAHDGYFIDIGIPESLAQADRELNDQLTRPAVFLDRDGVINQDKGYTHKVEDLVINPGAVDAIRAINDSGQYVIVITNQAGIARGYYSHEAVHRFHRHLQKTLNATGAHIDSFYFCPHHIEGSITNYAVECECRKPRPGLLMEAFSEWPIDKNNSVMIGDKPSDMGAADAAGIRGILFTNWQQTIGSILPSI